jgi:hypothetical protein
MNHNQAPKKARMDELGEFDKLFPELVECLNDGCLKEKQLQKVLEWFKEVNSVHNILLYTYIVYDQIKVLEQAYTENNVVAIM